MEPALANASPQLSPSCRDGEAGAWVEMVERFSRYVYASTTQAFRLSEADAEDLFQEVFARTYPHLHALRDDGAIRPWLGQLTRRLAIDRLRAGGREQAIDDLHESGVTDSALRRIEEALDLRRAMADLPEHCQEMLDRFFVRDESYQMIGETLDIPPGTIASRISRCLTKLRVRLGDK